MHDGDEKTLVFTADTLVITPYGNNETWTVTSKLDRKYCNASINFNVPGKPNPPPCAIGGTVWGMCAWPCDSNAATARTRPPMGRL